MLLLLLATPLAWWLARTRSRWRAPVGALVALPLVLPPTVLGFYLLVPWARTGRAASSRRRWASGLLPFTFGGLLVGSMLYSLPFVVQPLQHAFEAIGAPAAGSGGHAAGAPAGAFFSVALPLARPGFSRRRSWASRTPWASSAWC